MISFRKVISILLCIVMFMLALTSCNSGPQGPQGPQGEKGEDGVTPTISISGDGYWVINGVVTEHRAVGEDGADGEKSTVEISEDGYWIINGTKTNYTAVAQNGADGKDGSDGKDGITPLLNINSNTNEWEVSYDGGETWISLGVKATPEIDVENSSQEDMNIPDMTLNQFYIRNGETFANGDTRLMFASVYLTYSHRTKSTGTLYALERYLKNTSTSQSVYKSYDGGENWEKVGALELEAGSSYSDIFATDHTGTIMLMRYDGTNHYVETYDAELNLKSSLNIGTKKWLSVNHNVDAKYVTGVGEVIYFSEYTTTSATDLKVWRSLDGGETWKAVLTIPYGNNEKSVRHFHTCQIDPYTGHVWVTSGDSDLQSKVWKSADLGATWTLMGGGREGDNQLYRMCGLLFEEDAIYWGMDNSTAGVDTYLLKIDRSELSRELGEGERYLDNVQIIGKQTDGHAIYMLTRTFYPSGFLVFSVSEPYSEQTDRFVIQFYSFVTEKLYDIAEIPGNGKTEGQYNGIYTANRYADMLNGNVYGIAIEWITALNLSMANNPSMIFKINLS